MVQFHCNALYGLLARPGVPLDALLLPALGEVLLKPLVSVLLREQGRMASEDLDGGRLHARLVRRPPEEAPGGPRFLTQHFSCF